MPKSISWKFHIHQTIDKPCGTKPSGLVGCFALSWSWATEAACLLDVFAGLFACWRAFLCFLLPVLCFRFYSYSYVVGGRVRMFCSRKRSARPRSKITFTHPPWAPWARMAQIPCQIRIQAPWTLRPSPLGCHGPRTSSHIQALEPAGSQAQYL